MISDLPLNCRGLLVVAAAVAVLGVAGPTQSAMAHATTMPVVSPDQAAQSQRADGAIIVADNNDDNDHGHKNGKGKKSNNDHDGHWNNNGDNKNWNKNGQNWNGNKNKNWSGNGQNWDGNNGHWNKNGGKNWSNNNHWDNHWNHHGNDDWNGRAYVRGWQPRPYYGDFIGGVVLGSILAATGVGVVPYSPDPDLCWYWADPYMYRGYWDYCY